MGAALLAPVGGSIRAAARLLAKPIRRAGRAIGKANTPDLARAPDIPNSRRPIAA